MEAVLTLPLLREVVDHRLQAERVVWPVALVAEVELVLVRGFAADLARLAVQALPVGLEHLLDLVRRELQAVRVEALSTQCTRHEVLLVTK